MADGTVKVGDFGLSRSAVDDSVNNGTAAAGGLRRPTLDGEEGADQSPPPTPRLDAPTPRRAHAACHDVPTPPLL